MKGITRITLLVLFSLPLTPHAAESPTLEAFTTQAFQFTGVNAPVTQAFTLTVYSVDGIAQLEARLSADLPNDPKQAEVLALQRIQQLKSELKGNAQAAGTGLIQAQHYGLDRLPALVFHGEIIVYGITDLPTAIAHYQRWRSQQGKAQ